MEIYWYLTAPDGPQPWNAAGSYNIDYAWFQRVARGIDRLGFTVRCWRRGRTIRGLSVHR